MSAADSQYPRLEDQIDWLDRKSSYHQAWYRRLKVISIASAALVPLASSVEGYALLAGVCGVVVVIAEGLQHINQHHENWIRYRATCEDLRHEKYLYLARAAHYAELADDEAFRLLVANVEAVLSREGNDWLTIRRQLVDQQQD
jgi:hypothetical protein